jgi:hypothetical protein
MHLISLFACLMLLTSQAQAGPKDSPATLEQLILVVNWTNLPRPDGAANFSSTFLGCTYEHPGTPADVAAFYRRLLTQRGWVEDAARREQPSPPTLSFDKAGIQLSITSRRPGPNRPLRVTCRVIGNVDARKLPRPNDARLTANNFQVIAYSSQTSPADVATLLRKELTTRGWREVTDESEIRRVSKDRTVLCFWCNAMELIVSAAVNREGVTEVSYLVQVQEGLKP